MFIQLLPMIVQSFACFDRIQDFCTYGPRPATLDSQSSTFTSPSSTDIHLVPLKNEGDSKFADSQQRSTVSFKGDSFGWKKDQAVLHDLTVDIPRNAVTVVIGPVGSGKSSFLRAILGELIPMSPLTAGPAVGNPPDKGGVAYCPQSPWLENGTVRQNVLGVSLYDPKWYDAVISACGLEIDLQALQKGDYTLVGSNGVNLSGGQKQRIVSGQKCFSNVEFTLTSHLCLP